MKTLGEIEAAICEGISCFEQDYMGRGPKGIHTHLIGDLLAVRLQGVLTAAEQQLVKSLPAEKGRDLLKQVRTHLVETARPVLEAMVQEVTGVKVLSLHHDISTVTGEEVVLFTLAESPVFREAKKNSLSRQARASGPRRAPKCVRQVDRRVYKGTGWPRAVARPGLPQTRTCAINAFGSSSYPFATPRHTEWTARA
jgi:uncharacterized protein YbcI